MIFLSIYDTKTALSVKKGGLNIRTAPAHGEPGRNYDPLSYFLGFLMAAWAATDIVWKYYFVVQGKLNASFMYNGSLSMLNAQEMNTNPKRTANIKFNCHIGNLMSSALLSRKI